MSTTPPLYGPPPGGPQQPPGPPGMPPVPPPAEPSRRPISRGVWVTLIIGAWVVSGACGIAIGSAASSGDETPEAATTVTVTEQAEDPAADGEEAAPEPEPAPESAPEPEPQDEEPDTSGLTPAQENAVRSAESYLEFGPFSRSGLIEQLEFEDFSTEDAEVAVQTIEAAGGVDWNAEAVESAESYLEFSGFSRQGLIDQLIFEGFSDAEATQAADAVGL